MLEGVEVLLRILGLRGEQEREVEERKVRRPPPAVASLLPGRVCVCLLPAFPNCSLALSGNSPGAILFLLIIFFLLVVKIFVYFIYCFVVVFVWFFSVLFCLAHLSDE